MRPLWRLAMGTPPSVRAGAAFDLKAWHGAVLDLGPLGLAPLAAELART